MKFKKKKKRTKFKYKKTHVLLKIIRDIFSKKKKTQKNLNCYRVLTLATLAYTCAAKNVGTHPIIPFKQGPCLPESIAMQKFDPEKVNI